MSEKLKVLMLNGSPRKNGNVVKMVNAYSAIL